MRTFTAITMLLLVPPVMAQEAGSGTAPATGVDRIVQDAEALKDLVASDAAKCFLNSAASLPRIEMREAFDDPTTGRWYSPIAAAALPEEERAKLRRRPISEQVYYNTKYGSPLAFVRALDIAATVKAPGEERPLLETLEGARVLDFGYGTVGHLRLVALCSAHAVGVDVDPFLPAIYHEAEDQGEVGEGSVAMIHGRWPAEDDAVRAVANAGPYDLIVSKNTLKRGYLFPAREVDPRMLVDLGVEPEAFLASLKGALRPGGVVIMYNLSPALSKDDEPYKPWSDGRCPWSKEALEAAGFEVLAHDADDNATARDMARRLKWDATGMDPERDLFALYTILRNKR